MMSAVVFAIWNAVNYFKNDELPFSFKEGGTWTAVLLIFGGLLGFAAQSLSFFTSQRVHPALFSLTGQLGVFYCIILDHFLFQTRVNRL